MAGKKKIMDLTIGVSQAGKLPAVVYGLKGIMDIFQVSKSTALRYKNGFLRDAVTQNGNVIMVDTRKALICFGMTNPDGLVLDE